MNGKRIDYLDGLKGMSALLVFIYHISIITFYNGFVGFGTPYASDPVAAKEVVFSNFIAAIFTNNSFGLYLFFVMIAIFPIISYRKHNNDTIILGKSSIKRYFQLLAPCLPAAFANVTLYWAGLNFFPRLADEMNCAWLDNCQPIGCETFLDFIKTVFVTIWYSSKTNALAPMWCMSIIFIGSFGVYASYALLGKSKLKYLPCIALALISIFYPTMIYFAIGSFITEFLFLKTDRKSNKIVTVILLIVGTILIKLPVQVYPVELKTDYMCGFGAGLVIWAVSDSAILKRLLSCKALTFLGRISFEIILVHFVFMSNIGVLVCEWIMKYTASPYIITAVYFIFLLPFTILFSWLINKFISTPVNKLLKKTTDKIF